jgi:hypothetical protein
LREPSAYRSETFVGHPLLHDLPWISEFDFDLINATELCTLKIYPQGFAAELGAPEFEMTKPRKYNARTGMLLNRAAANDFSMSRWLLKVIKQSLENAWECWSRRSSSISALGVRLRTQRDVNL